MSLDWNLNDISDDEFDENALGDDDFSDNEAGEDEGDGESTSSSDTEADTKPTDTRSDSLVYNPGCGSMSLTTSTGQTPTFPLPAEVSFVIFAYLPFSDRLSNTAVCKHWRQLLNDDHELKSGIFLKAAKFQSPFTPLEITSRTGHNLEEFMEKWHNSLNTAEYCTKFRCEVLNSHRAVDPSYVNPVFLDKAVNEDTCLRINGHCASFVWVMPDSIAKFLALHETSPRDASWRGMLLTNPPVRKFWGYSDIKGDVVSHEDGITLDMVAEYLKGIVGREANGDGMRGKRVGDMLCWEKGLEL